MLHELYEALLEDDQQTSFNTDCDHDEFLELDIPASGIVTNSNWHARIEQIAA